MHDLHLRVFESIPVQLGGRLQPVDSKFSAAALHSSHAVPDELYRLQFIRTFCSGIQSLPELTNLKGTPLASFEQAVHLTSLVLVLKPWVLQLTIAGRQILNLVV